MGARIRTQNSEHFSGATKLRKSAAGSTRVGRFSANGSGGWRIVGLVKNIKDKVRFAVRPDLDLEKLVKLSIFFGLTMNYASRYFHAALFAYEV
ncbi:hypothetical protein EBR21_13130 [bacterium]|nr:hypothetical protein [bacterium]